LQDMWGIGCVLFETLALFPLFPGSNEADQIERIHKVGGVRYRLIRLESMCTWGGHSLCTQGGWSISMRRRGNA